MLQIEKTDKFLTMIGFAKRAGKIIYGYDTLRKSKSVRLLAVSDTASQNLLSDMMCLAVNQGLPIVTAPKLEEAIGNNVKALGITDENMARAVVDYVTRGATKYKIKLG
ncbi:MAG: hypothetical protein J1G01_04980 [Clostridiales bacterium]|nr:hypothetical protein [Clostridiales bacterium]